MPDDLQRFVALDVEIACRSPLSICAIGLARFESGIEVAEYESLVRFSGRVRYTHIHGLTGADLRDAPPWPIVWKHALDVLAGTRTVVAFRATFDRAALMAMCARHAVRLPRLRFVCAAAAYQKHAGRPPADLASALRALNIPFPGRPHDPIADARAAAALVLATHPGESRSAPIQFSKNPGVGGQARSR